MTQTPLPPNIVFTAGHGGAAIGTTFAPGSGEGALPAFTPPPYKETR